MRRILVSAVMINAACILPPEIEDPVFVPNQAPRIILDRVTPEPAVSQIGADCLGVSFSAPARDPDDASIRFRWTVRDIETTRWVPSTEAPSTGEPGTDRNAFTRLQVASNFAAQIRETGVVGGNTTAVVTLHVTDSPEWAVVDPNVFDPDAPDRNPEQIGPGVFSAGFNLGALPDITATGGQSFSVVTHSWALSFVPGEGCPQ